MNDSLRNLILDSYEREDYGFIADRRHDPLEIQLQIEQEVMRLLLMHNEAGLDARRHGKKRLPPAMFESVCITAFPCPKRDKLYTADIDECPSVSERMPAAERKKMRGMILGRLRKRRSDCAVMHGMVYIVTFQTVVEWEIARFLHMHKHAGFEAQRWGSPRRPSLTCTLVYDQIDRPRPQQVACR